jgi:predicted HicB family RNase H-like nuclease
VPEAMPKRRADRSGAVYLHRIAPEVAEALREQAWRERSSQNAVAEKALREYLGLPPASGSEQ